VTNKIIMAFGDSEVLSEALKMISRRDGKALAVVAPAPNAKLGQTVEMTAEFLLDSLRVQRDTQIEATKRARKKKKET